MKVLITGAGGQLGSDLAAAFANHDVIAVPRSGLDITDEAAIMAIVERHAPDLVANAAAFTKVDVCEAEPDTAWRINALGPWWLARACDAAGASLLHISTDYVFDGTSDRAYTEFDATNPQSVYGRSKAAGEELVRRVLSRHFIVRTSWLQGVVGPNFVKTMLRLRERPAVSVVDDQVGSPTFTFDLAPALEQLGATGRFGTYHVTNTGTCSWFELANAIFEEAGVDVAVNPIDTATYGAPAPRPANSALDNRLARLTGIGPLPPWRQSLGHLVQTLTTA